MRNIIIVFCLVTTFLCQQSYAIDDIKLDSKSSLFSVMDKTVPIVTSSYAGWAENWKWAGAKITPNPSAKSGEATSYSGKNKNLGIDFIKTITQNNNQLIFNYQWNKSTDIPNAIGFGIGFKLNLTSQSFESPAKDPELLPGNQGWRWETPDGTTLEVKFTPAIAKIYFERDKKNMIRALFFTSITEGTAQTTMTVSVSGKNATSLRPITSESNNSSNESNWRKHLFADTASPIDLSYLNANDLPAGKHGFVKASSDQLVFEDGTPIKFWGTNVIANALFKSTDDEVKRHAKRLAKLGFNLVRLHHHDSIWVKPNIFENPEDNTQKLSESSLKKLDWWIKCLKEEGIYIWLDLHVGRSVTANDSIDIYDDLVQNRNKKNAQKEKKDIVIKGFNYYNESIQKQMQAFNRAYLNHINSFASRAYKEDPAIIALLITNENDLTQHFGSLVANSHNEAFSEDSTKFANTNGLDVKKVKRVWDMGEAKIYLSDVEHRFNQKMIAHIHELGSKPMITTTNSWGYMGLFGLPSLTDGDLIDTHSYGKADEFKFNPRFNPGFLTWIGASQVTGKPLSTTEWNLDKFPIADRFTTPLYTASIAALQGWDAMMLFGYSQNPFENKPMLGIRQWSEFNDPAIMGLMPACALLYRQDHVSAARMTYRLQLSENDFFYKKQDPSTSKTIRTLLETSRLTVDMPATKLLPWLKSHDSSSTTGQVISDPNKDFIPQGQNFVESDTRELKRDWSQGIHSINTSKSQIISGSIGGKSLSLKDVEFKINTEKAVIAVQSLENNSIKDSKSLFITAMANSVPSDQNKEPYLSEPVTGEIQVSAPAGLTLFPINPEGEKGTAIKTSYKDGKYQIQLNDKTESLWYILSKN